MASARKKKVSHKVRQLRLTKTTYWIFDIAKREKDFIVILAVLLLAGVLVAPYPRVAMWFGFALASYSTIANDSIQTIGTFIATNSHRSWWKLWLFMGIIFVATITYSWVIYDGDVSYQRLAQKGFSEAPKSFNALQLFAPIALLVLTRMHIPVSTTFLLLNTFATEPQAIFSVLQKSFYGYFIAFFSAIIIWCLIAYVTDRYFRGRASSIWIPIQWAVSGLLWSIWLVQDASNIAVFLPRSLDLIELCLFMGLIIAGLGLLFYLKGDRMQHLINEKVGLTDIRAATLVDFVYMFILFYFKNLSNIPMSTTWVFIGLLGGRELAISLAKDKPKRREKAIKKSWKFIRKDFRHALIGLVVSMVLAIIVNPVIREAVQRLCMTLLDATYVAETTTVLQ